MNILEFRLNRSVGHLVFKILLSNLPAKNVQASCGSECSYLYFLVIYELSRAATLVFNASTSVDSSFIASNKGAINPLYCKDLDPSSP